MILNLDVNIIAQGTMVLVLVGVARVVYTASITIATVATELKLHREDDTNFHAEVRADIRELRARPAHTSVGGNGKWPG
jgi:hypothetical protein